jgi:O-antigen/teichoic acid export membrane protein
MLAVAINTDVLKFIFLKQEAYWEGLSIVPPLLLGYLFLGVYYNFTVWFKLTDKTFYGTIITGAGAFLTITLNFMLIPIAGYLGSSWVTVLVYGFMMVVCYWLGQKYYPIPYKVIPGLAYITCTYLLILVVNSISFTDQVRATGFHGAIIVAYATVIYFVEKKYWQEHKDF